MLGSRCFRSHTSRTFIYCSDIFFHSLNGGGNVKNKKPVVIIQCDDRLSHIQLDMQQIRSYAKSKSRGVSGKQKGHIPDPSSFRNVLNVHDYVLQLEAILQILQEELVSELTLRSGTKALEQLNVEIPADGNKVGSKATVHKLNHIAKVSLKNPQLAILNMSSNPNATKPVTNAIINSGMNVTPQQQGNLLYVALPKPTKEHRQQLADGAKTMAQRAIDKMRKVEQAQHRQLQKSSGSKPKDEVFDAQKYIEHVLRTMIDRANHMVKEKQQELLREI